MRYLGPVAPPSIVRSVAVAATVNAGIAYAEIFYQLRIWLLWDVAIPYQRDY
jgi:hypothetical protein